jgi:hypothetical protein
MKYNRYITERHEACKYLVQNREQLELQSQLHDKMVASGYKAGLQAVIIISLIVIAGLAVYVGLFAPTF